MAYMPLSIKICALGIEGLLLNLVKTRRKETRGRLKKSL
jgi:hypothetical protein